MSSAWTDCLRCMCRIWLCLLVRKALPIAVQMVKRLRMVCCFVAQRWVGRCLADLLTCQTQKAKYTKKHTAHAHAILDEVLDRSPGVRWTDIAGLSVAKQILQVLDDVFMGLGDLGEG